MCVTYYCQQPVCACIYLSGVVVFCSLFKSLPENKDKTFNPKLLTGHCQGLDLLFNGVNYMSVDVDRYDIVPTGLDCPETELRQEGAIPGACPLCDTPGTLRFLKAKGVQYTWAHNKVALDKAAERVAKSEREKTAGKSVERSMGGSADNPRDTSVGE